MDNVESPAESPTAEKTATPEAPQVTTNQETPPSSETPPKSNEVDTPAKPKKKINKKILMGILALITLLFAGALVYCWSNINNSRTTSMTQPASETFAFKASVVYLTGDASKIVDNRKVEIKEGDVLEEGDIIHTGEDTYLVLNLDDGSVIRVGDDTTLTLTKLKSEETIINEEVGIVFVRVEKDKNHRFITKAGDVTVESLGTSFSVEKDEDVNVKVFESKVSVTTKNEKATEVAEDEEWNSTDEKVEEIDQKKLATNEFIDWSLKEEKLVDPTPKLKPTVIPQPTTPPTSSTGITLSGSATGNGISLSWSVSGVDTPKGFKLVKNQAGNPSYPGGDPFKYLSDPGSRSYTWQITDGQTWHFRICQYTGSGCGTYSNEITVTAPSGNTKTTETLESQINLINLSVVKSSDTKARLTWTVDGTANAFKAVWSKSSSPVYPTRKGDWATYLGGGSREYEIGSLETGQTYYFRVCEYLSGSCGTYSNETSISF